jgi:hypothetical protein
MTKKYRVPVEFEVDTDEQALALVEPDADGLNHQELLRRGRVVADELASEYVSWYAVRRP